MEKFYKNDIEDVFALIPNAGMDSYSLIKGSRKWLFIDKVGVYDNFFDLAANPYHMNRINNKIKKDRIDNG